MSRDITLALALVYTIERENGQSPATKKLRKLLVDIDARETRHDPHLRPTKRKPSGRKASPVRARK